MNTIALIKGLAGKGGGGSSLPTTPAQDGTYNLQNTVSSGTGTLSWASGGSSGGGVLVVGTTVSENRVICDKTCKEMWDAMKTGGVLVDGTTFVYTIVYATNDDGYTFCTYNENITFDGVNDDDYPWTLLE